MTILNVRIDPTKQPWLMGNSIHIQKQTCARCKVPMGGIAIDLDYVQHGDELITHIVAILDKHKVRSICANCLTNSIKNQLTEDDIKEWK